MLDAILSSNSTSICYKYKSNVLLIIHTAAKLVKRTRTFSMQSNCKFNYLIINFCMYFNEYIVKELNYNIKLKSGVADLTIFSDYNFQQAPHHLYIFQIFEIMSLIVMLIIGVINPRIN